MGQTLFYFYFGSGNTFVYDRGNLAVHFVDVGHGDCTIIQLPDGKIAIIDGGSEYYWLRVDKYIKERIKPKKRKIDYVINTHPDSDHLDGLKHIKSEYNVGEFIDYTNFAEYYEKIITPQYRIKITAYKEFDDEEHEYADNDLSPIITVEYAKQVFIITGDAGFETEKEFISSTHAFEIFGEGRADLVTTYLKVGHHGSKNSTCTDFLDFIKPDKAVISVGTLYNLPSTETLNLLNEYQIETYITRDDGNIVFLCKGNDVKMFFAFDNPPNMVGIYVVIFMIIIALCFINFKKHNI
jgi:beta-lactamase superfamily II metal-dependent hydrolase